MKESFQEPKKEANLVWKRARPRDIIKPEGYEDWKFRWVTDDPGRVEQMLAEHWVLVNRANNLPIEQSALANLEANNLDSCKRHRGQILMALPPEWAEARARFIADKTRKQTAGLKRDLVDRNRNAAGELGSQEAAIHGNITIIE